MPKIDSYKGAIQEKRFEYKGFPCVVLMQALGFRTGYVGIPKGHELYGVGYGNIDIDCHGGLTYSSNYLIDQNDDDMWWIGFDCGHYCDGYDMDRAVELFKDYPEVIKQINSMQEIDIFNIYTSEHAKSLKFCEEQCRLIVDQLEVQADENNE